MKKKEPINIAVTGAAGQIAYSLLFRIASGAMFGPDQPVALRLIDLPQMQQVLEGMVMELDDCAFSLLKNVTITSELNEGFRGVNWALLIGSVPRKQGMERADLLSINGKIFVGQAQAIQTNAASDIRILVVGNPCNTNCWIAYNSASEIPKNRWFSMMRLDQNRAKTQLAQKANVDISEISNLAVWGNHSPSMFPDFTNAKIGGKPITSVIKDHEWLKTTFLQTVQQRGGEVIKKRGASSAASAANAVVDTVRSLVTPTAKGDCHSVAVVSDGSYDVPKGIMCSFPIRTAKNGQWEIIQDFKLDEFAKSKIKITVDDLVGERKIVSEMLSIKEETLV